MFRISETEWGNMSSQFVTTFRAKRPKTSLPYAFTEQGVAMLSAVLRSKPAIQVSISIMKATFCNLPRYLPSCWSYAVGCSWWNATAGRTWRLWMIWAKMYEKTSMRFMRPLEHCPWSCRRFRTRHRKSDSKSKLWIFRSYRIKFTRFAVSAWCWTSIWCNFTTWRLKPWSRLSVETLNVFRKILCLKSRTRSLTRWKTDWGHKLWPVACDD